MAEYPKLKQLASYVLQTSFPGYDTVEKKRYRTKSMAAMREVATALGYSDKPYRFNPGGDAVPGDPILHTDHVYVNFCVDMLGNKQFMWRTCKGRRDYTGGPNNWYPWSKLKENPEAFVAMLQKLHEPIAHYA